MTPKKIVEKWELQSNQKGFGIDIKFKIHYNAIPLSKTIDITINAIIIKICLKLIFLLVVLNYYPFFHNFSWRIK